MSLGLLDWGQLIIAFGLDDQVVVVWELATEKVAAASLEV